MWRAFAGFVTLTLGSVVLTSAASAAERGGQWPPRMQGAVIQNCEPLVSNTAKPDKVCSCLLGKLEQKYTFEEFRRVSSPGHGEVGETTAFYLFAFNYCLLTNRPVDTNRRWPTSTRDTILKVCKKGFGKSDKTCRCAFDRLQERFTVADWNAADPEEASDGLAFMGIMCEGGTLR